MLHKKPFTAEEIGLLIGDDEAAFSQQLSQYAGQLGATKWHQWKAGNVNPDSIINDDDTALLASFLGDEAAPTQPVFGITDAIRYTDRLHIFQYLLELFCLLKMKVSRMKAFPNERNNIRRDGNFVCTNTDFAAVCRIIIREK